MFGKKSEKQNQKKRTGIGLALWLLAALVLLVFFLVNQKRIASNLKATGFFNKAGLKTPEFVERAPDYFAADKNDVAPIESVEIDLNGVGSHADEKRFSEKNVLPQNDSARKQQEEAKIEKKSDEQIPSAEKKPEQKKETVVKKEVEVKTETAAKTMKLKLFFMTINSSGNVSRIEVVREMKKSDGPLVDAINALIGGPTPAEQKLGCRSQISKNTRLLGASVKDGIATLNFSDDFQFNEYGMEGLRDQLQQIVFTATAFPTVERVQFLVSGERREYLGEDSTKIMIYAPLGRSNFL